MFIADDIPTNKEIFDFIAGRLPFPVRSNYELRIIYDVKFGAFVNNGFNSVLLSRSESDPLVIALCEKYIGKWHAIRRLELELDPQGDNVPVFKVEMYAMTQPSVEEVR